MSSSAVPFTETLALTICTVSLARLYSRLPQPMHVRVFIENEAGSCLKNHYNERTLLFQRAVTVSRPYPFPYGFIIGTANADGDCLDCFVITRRMLRSGDVMECEAIGLMEQTEDGLTDNNVLARPVDEPPAASEVRMVLTEFVQNVFSHIPGKTIGVGRFLGLREAQEEIERCRARVEVREQPMTALVNHAEVPIAFVVESELDVSARRDGTFDLAERHVQRYVKDYDAVEPPAEWARRCDLTRWSLLAAYRHGERVGGAVVAFDTPGLDLLEGLSDLALLWDLRVRPDARRQGIGAALFNAAAGCARTRGCTQLKVETQNVNVPACRFYQQRGCRLRAVNRRVYSSCPDEIQMLWYKEL